MRAVRSWSWMAALVVAVVATPGSAHAEDPAAPKLPDPYFRAGDLALRPQSKLPEGWAAVPEGGAAAEKVGAGVRETLAAAQVEPGRVSLFVTQVKGPAGAEAALATVDTDPLLTPGGPAPVATLLEAASAARGWTVKAVGGPTCAFVYAGPADSREALTSAALAWAAEGLTARAQRMAQNGDPLVALATLKLALTLEPKAGFGNMLAGNIYSALAQQKRPGGDFAAAITHFDAALKGEGLYPLEARARYGVRGMKAVALLMAGEAEQAYTLYQELLADPLTAADGERWGTTYNTACAASRVGKLDEAFKLLGTVLEQDAKETVDGISHWREDPDFAAMKADPRWKALLEKYPE
jgi:tetratricopeptide (TPR) repeat protein